MFSTYLQRRLLRYAFIDSPVYLALFSSPGVELPTAGTGYARKLVPLQLFATSPVVVRNPSQLQFGPAPSNWGTVTHVAVYDAASGGNVLVPPQALEAPKTLSPGGVLTFEPHGLEFRL